MLKVFLLVSILLIVGIILYLGRVFLIYTNLQQPKITVDDWYWSKELHEGDVEEKDIPEVISTANNYIAEKNGREFLQKYIKFNPYQTGFSEGKTVYYLHYTVNIPEKGLDFKTTTHPVEIMLTIRNDLSLVDPSQISDLPDCNNIKTCLERIDRKEAIATVINDMKKTGYVAPEILLDWELESLQWYIRYNLPPWKLPECNGFGGDVTILYDSFNNKVVERTENCNHPSI